MFTISWDDPGPFLSACSALNSDSRFCPFRASAVGKGILSLFLLTALLTSNVIFSPPTGSGHQVRVLPFNSVLTLP